MSALDAAFMHLIDNSRESPEVTALGSISEVCATTAFRMISFRGNVLTQRVVAGRQSPFKTKC